MISSSKRELEEVSNEDRKLKNEILTVQSEPTDDELERYGHFINLFFTFKNSVYF